MCCKIPHKEIGMVRKTKTPAMNQALLWVPTCGRERESNPQQQHQTKHQVKVHSIAPQHSDHQGAADTTHPHVRSTLSFCSSQMHRGRTATNRREYRTRTSGRIHLRHSAHEQGILAASASGWATGTYRSSVWTWRMKKSACCQKQGGY